MKKLRVLLACIAVSCFLSACGSDDGGGGGMATTDFTGFVKSLIAATVDSAEPVEINSTEFSFTEDETAFDDVL